MVPSAALIWRCWDAEAPASRPSYGFAGFPRRTFIGPNYPEDDNHHIKRLGHPTKEAASVGGLAFFRLRHFQDALIFFQHRPQLFKPVQIDRCLNIEPVAARRFVFSVQHNHIRLGDPTLYGNVGLVIFQFEALKDGVRKAIAHFDAGTSFWSGKEIGSMIDEVYRVLDEIRRAA